MKRTATVIAALLVASMVAPAAAVGVAAAAQDAGNETTATATPASGGESEASGEFGYTLNELRSDGRQPSDSPESVRLSRDGEMLWLIHWPARSFTADEGNTADDKWKFVGENGRPVVSSNSVYLRTIRTEPGSKTVDLTLISYRTETRTTTHEDGSKTNEKVPVDVIKREVTVTLEPGWSIGEVKLPDEEEDREVLLYADDAPNELRWHFSHEPVATMQTAPISTEGDYLWRVTKHVFLPALLGLFVSGGVVKGAIQRAGKGPGIGLFGWLLILGVGAFLGFLFGPLESFADLLVAAPILMAIALVVVATIVFLESWEARTSKTLFIKPDVQAAQSATGEDAVDALLGEEDVETMVEMPDGGRAVVRDGFFSFLSRAIGGCAAYVPKAETINASIELTGDDHDELVFVKPDFQPTNEDGDPVDGAIEYEPEGWTIEWPEVETLNDAAKVTLAGVAVMLATGAVYSAFGGFFAFLTVTAGFGLAVVRPTDGHATFEPAEGHTRSAMITALVMAKDVSDAETLQDARRQKIKLLSKNAKDVEEALDDQDATLIESMFSDDVDLDEVAITSGETSDENGHSGALTDEVVADDD